MSVDELMNDKIDGKKRSKMSSIENVQ